MKIYLFGSCRIWTPLTKINSINILNLKYKTLLHSIGQYIQEIDFLNKNLLLDDKLYPYIYYSTYSSELLNNKEKILDDNLNLFNEAEYIIAEIQTLKYVIKDGIELDIVQIGRYCDNASKFNIQSYNKTTFRDKLIQFINKTNKKIIFIGHYYDANIGIKKINTRLIQNKIVSTVIDNKKTFFINPSNIFEKHNWNEIMSDSSHLNNFGINIITEFYIEKINNIIHQ